SFVRVELTVDIRAPEPVALLQTQRVERTPTERGDALRLAGLPQRVPQPQSVLGRRVDLPTQLADVGDSDGESRHGAHRDRARRQVRKDLVGEVLLDDRLDPGPGAGPP